MGLSKLTVTVKLLDRAGNIGEASKPSTFIIRQCLTCGGIGAGSGQWKYPVRHPNRVVTAHHQAFRGYSGHTGIDFALPGASASYGFPIHASAAGRVIYAGYNASEWYYGNQVVIDHGNGYWTLYAHLKDISVQTGQFVTENDVIGAMGNSGNVDPKPTPQSPLNGTHLHFEIRAGRNLQDNNVPPELYLDKDLTKSNASTPEEQALCEGGGSGGADLEAYPTINQDEAKNLIADYLKNNIGHYTTIENYNPTTNYREEIQIKDILTKYPNTPETEVFKQYLYLEQSCNIYHLNLQRTENRNNQEIAYDAVIVVNPYNKQAYMVKNGIFEKYVASNKWCGVVGVPKAENGMRECQTIQEQ